MWTKMFPKLFRRCNVTFGKPESNESLQQVIFPLTDSSSHFIVHYTSQLLLIQHKSMYYVGPKLRFPGRQCD